MSDTQKRLHAVLDGDTRNRPDPNTPGGQELARYEKAMGLLEACQENAPEDLCGSVMAALPSAPKPSFKDLLLRWWPGGREWALPAFAGVFCVVILMVAAILVRHNFSGDRLEVHFLFHAPWARQVEVVGAFTHWMPGKYKLAGPDGAGNWYRKTSLPPGRHEYLFLVDGRELMPDPLAGTSRPDGFGGVNSVLDLFPEDYVVHNPARPEDLPEEWQRFELAADTGLPWRKLANTGISGGADPVLTERTLARFVFGGRQLTQSLHEAVSKVFESEKRGFPSEYLFACLNEAALKRVSDEAIVEAVKRGLQNMERAYVMIHGEEPLRGGPEGYDPILIAVAEALQSGVPEQSLAAMLAGLREKPEELRMALTESGEALHVAGLGASGLNVFFRGCTKKEMAWESIREVTARMKKELMQGGSGQQILDALLANAQWQGQPPAAPICATSGYQFRAACL